MSYKIRGNKLYVCGTVEGKHYRLSTGKEATAINIKWLKKNHRDVLLKLVVKEKPKDTEIFNEYALHSIQANIYSISEGTQKNYTCMLNKNILPYFKNYRLDEIKPSDIRAFQSKLLKSMDGRSAKNVRILLGKILGEAVMDELIDRNPVKLVKPPRYIPKDDIIPFTLEEVETLIANTSEFMQIFLTVAFFTGMRSGELSALKWEDIDFNSKKIVVRRSMRHGKISSTKTGKTRIIDMLEPVEQSLKEHFKSNGLKYEFVFTNRKGTPYCETSSITTTYWKPLLKRCGMAYRVLYNTRHTFASLMLANGEDILWVSKMLGHAKVSTTTIYYTKFVEEKGKKRAQFLNEKFTKNCTLSAQSNNEKGLSA